MNNSYCVLYLNDFILLFFHKTFFSNYFHILSNFEFLSVYENSKSLKVCVRIIKSIFFPWVIEIERVCEISEN
jgi:hypothetical protein